jgi:uncharacterized membrane protein YdjX (TVP38/TMEM64 family)
MKLHLIFCVIIALCIAFSLVCYVWGGHAALTILISIISLYIVFSIVVRRFHKKSYVKKARQH